MSDLGNELSVRSRESAFSTASLTEGLLNVVDNSRYFDRKVVKGIKWLDKNPYDVTTDRENFVIKKNLPIYRAMYIRNSSLFIN